MKIFSNYHTVIVIHSAFILIILTLLKNYGTNFFFTIEILPVAFWIFVRSKIKLEDNSIHYIVAILYFGIAITIASLSFEEIKMIINDLNFDAYFHNKILLNVFGWVGLPLCVTELIKTAQFKKDN
ncbi:hypothetical protein E4T80_11545 [Muribacter muris]|uniref:Uncharacterized protein n=1 Tax=Muribacter muris TaxID=67855 RepID=A0A4Y9JQK8_9PAST|nr:hypothetical protein [Muribacter muris]MBF0786094.1 hypothetical protein [Muribacter muris]MBF0826922.1 hypothetical protein [Muribacter muris]TFV07981.1 hypothetical protein E4T80_11545 [Muribacter muris]